MDFYPAIWNVLHDGTITAIAGSVPGTVRLDVSIDYLRQRFADSGRTIQVILTGCTRFAYRDYEAKDFTTDLSAIASIQPEVLSAEMRGDLSEICCVGGTLEVRASSGSLALDSGRRLTLEELIAVSEAYWTEWEENWKAKRK